MPGPTLSLIAAVARNGGIGRNNALLVRLPDDLQHFKRTTMGAPIVMGRKTWDSIARVLPGRRHVVVTRNATLVVPAGVETAPSLEVALERLAGEPKVFVIGGASLYAAALPIADELVLTEIDADLESDTFFPPWRRNDFRQTARDTKRSPDGFDYSFVTYIKKRGD